MGPIGLIQDGDIIVIDAEKGTMDVELSEAELAERKKSFKPKPAGFKTGALARYAKNVGPARDGADVIEVTMADEHHWILNGRTRAAPHIEH